MQPLKGDFVQYFNAQGNLIGYGLVVDFNGWWCVVLDQYTGKKEHWNPNLVNRIVK